MGHRMRAERGTGLSTLPHVVPGHGGEALRGPLRQIDVERGGQPDDRIQPLRFRDALQRFAQQPSHFPALPPI